MKGMIAVQIRATLPFFGLETSSVGPYPSYANSLNSSPHCKKAPLVNN